MNIEVVNMATGARDGGSTKLDVMPRGGGRTGVRSKASNSSGVAFFKTAERDSMSYWSVH